MRYSQAVEWAVCILALIAAEDQTMTNEALHRRLKVSSSYLKKINRKLVVGGLIKSSYGASGGFKLARDMRKITLYDLVEAIEGHEPFFKTTGLLEKVFAKKIERARIGRSLLHKAFSEAQVRLEDQLKKTTMAQILAEVRNNNVQKKILKQYI